MLNYILFQLIYLFLFQESRVLLTAYALFLIIIFVLQVQQIDGQIDRKIERKIDRQKDRNTDRKTHRKTDRKTDRKIDRKTDGETEIGRQIDIEIAR